MRALRLRTVWLVLLVACVANLAVLSAKSADMQPPNETPAPAPAVPAVDQPVPWQVPGGQFEAHFGVSYRQEGIVDPNTFNISGSIVTPRMNFGVTGYWANLLPRFQVGGSLNFEGKTSFAYTDIVLTLPITNWLFFEPFFGGAIHDGSLTPTPTLSGLGCPFLFHVGGSFGVPITEHWQVLGTFEHLSNGRGIFGVDCGTNEVPGGNQGLNNYGVSVGYAF